MVVSFARRGALGVSKALRTPTFLTTIFVIFDDIVFPAGMLSLHGIVGKGESRTECPKNYGKSLANEVG